MSQAGEAAPLRRQPAQARMLREPLPQQCRQAGVRAHRGRLLQAGRGLSPLGWAQEEKGDRRAAKIFLAEKRLRGGAQRWGSAPGGSSLTLDGHPQSSPRLRTGGFHRTKSDSSRPVSLFPEPSELAVVGCPSTRRTGVPAHAQGGFGCPWSWRRHRWVCQLCHGSGLPPPGLGA